MHIWLLEESFWPQQRGRPLLTCQVVQVLRRDPQCRVGSRHEVSIGFSRNGVVVTTGAVVARYLGGLDLDKLSLALGRGRHARRLLVMREPGEPRLKGLLPPLRAPITVHEAVYEPVQVRDATSLLVPILGILALAAAARRLCTETRYSWLLLSRYLVGSRITGFLDAWAARLHVLAPYVTLRQCVTLLSLDAGRFREAFQQVANAIASDHHRLAQVLGQLGVQLPMDAFCPSWPQDAWPRVLETWRAKAQRGALVLATASVLVAICGVIARLGP